MKPIKNESDYRLALENIDRLMDAEPNTPEGDRLDILTTFVEAYETNHFPIEAPDPIEAIQYRMNDLGMTRKDLGPLLGTRARVSEILARKRPLTLSMIRKIHKTLRILTDILIHIYRSKENLK